MYRIILVPCVISCAANSPCPAMRDGPIRTRIFTRGCLLGCADVLPVLSLLDNTAPNIGAPMGRRTAFPGGVDHGGYRVGWHRVSGGVGPRHGSPASWTCGTPNPYDPMAHDCRWAKEGLTFRTLFPGPMRVFRRVLSAYFKRPSRSPPECSSRPLPHVITPVSPSVHPRAYAAGVPLAQPGLASRLGYSIHLGQ
jgi:hypothetical protein